MKIRSFGCLAVLILAGCATPQTRLNYLEAVPTQKLWAEHRSAYDPMDVALIEAELGKRNALTNGDDYVGKRTASAYGNALYARSKLKSKATPQKTSGSRDDYDCSDFGSAGEAQKFFLRAGGPISDPHNLDADGDGLACEWGRIVSRNATTSKRALERRYTPVRRMTSSRCYVGPRGGTYTITAGGYKNYDGC